MAGSRHARSALRGAMVVVPIAAVCVALAHRPTRAEQRPGRAPAHSTDAFQTADSCLVCHNGLTTASGEDVSIGAEWRGSMMANSARDPYWQAAVRRETIDHPQAAGHIEDACATCHMPVARAHAAANGRAGRVFAHLPVRSESGSEDRLAHDGVSCTICHQITPAKLGTPDSFNGGFVIDVGGAGDAPKIFGPFDVDRGRTTIMRSATGYRPTESAHVRQSELCATCHTLYTDARGPGGELTGRLPEQVPYLEWRHSEFRGSKTCQACHMPVVAEETPIVSVLGQPRAGLARHGFRGGNVFMLGMLNRFRAELGVVAQPQELDSAMRRTRAMLQEETAIVSIEPIDRSATRLDLDVIVMNLTGHKLPTGYPSRRAWLHLVVRDRDGGVIFESGKAAHDGSIAGNDNDTDPGRFEPHYSEIRQPDEVQIYESVMGDGTGTVTTGLLSGARYLKDNRLLPRGFDKETAVPDIAVVGTALRDANFTGHGDRVRYSIDVTGRGGPFTIDAEFCFQPIGFRWAQNLRPYDAAETRRFVRYYDAMSSSSSTVLTRSSTSTR